MNRPTVRARADPRSSRERLAKSSRLASRCPSSGRFLSGRLDTATTHYGASPQHDKRQHSGDQPPERRPDADKVRDAVTRKVTSADSRSLSLSMPPPGRCLCAEESEPRSRHELPGERCEYRSDRGTEQPDQDIEEAAETAATYVYRILMSSRPMQMAAVIAADSARGTKGRQHYSCGSLHPTIGDMGTE